MPIKWNHALLAAIEAEVKKEIVAQTLVVDAEAKRLIIDTPKTGIVYKRKGVTHQSSAPGEPYASDTGQTVSRIRTEVRDDGFKGAVVFGGKNAWRMEYGTPKMEARPYARISLNNKRKEVNTAINAAIRRGMKAT